MGIFKNLTAEEVAAQHQLLIDMLLHVLCTLGGDNRQGAAASIEKMIAGFQETGKDTTILEFSLSSLTQKSVQK